MTSACSASLNRGPVEIGDPGNAQEVNKSATNNRGARNRIITTLTAVLLPCCFSVYQRVWIKRTPLCLFRNQTVSFSFETRRIPLLQQIHLPQLTRPVHWTPLRLTLSQTRGGAGSTRRPSPEYRPRRTDAGSARCRKSAPMPSCPDPGKTSSHRRGIL